MNNGIAPCQVEENNLMAQKSQDDFGGPNMWRLYIREVSGHFEYVQWMNVYSIQRFFKTKLPVYNEDTKKKKYTLKNS